MMIILLILGTFWAFMFLLCLALVTSNSRVRIDHEPHQVEFELNPLILPTDEQLEPLRELAIAKLNSIEAHRDRAVHGARKSVFVVDDDPDILKLITHVLDVEGFDVHSFTDPEVALAEFKSSDERPSMVVTDFAMQPMNGLEFISKCRETDPELKTIVISGMVDEKSIGALPHSTDRFIAKPFKVRSLVDTLNETFAAN
jgi:CheY-like chemotaxis protein